MESVRFPQRVAARYLILCFAAAVIILGVVILTPSRDASRRGQKDSQDRDLSFETGSSKSYKSNRRYSIKDTFKSPYKNNNNNNKNSYKNDNHISPYKKSFLIYSPQVQQKRTGRTKRSHSTYFNTTICHPESCYGRCVEHSQPYAYCYCDIDCDWRGDCCYDYERECAKHLWPETGYNLTSMLKRRSEKRSQKGYHKFQEQVKFLTAYQEPLTIPLVNKCPSTFNDESIRQKCEKPNELIPIENTISTESGVIFRNIYCATCHGKKANKVTPIPVEITCEQDFVSSLQTVTNLLLRKEGVENAVGSGNCTYGYDIFKFSPRYSPYLQYSKVIYTCNQSLADVVPYFALHEAACLNYQSWVSLLGRDRVKGVYKNEHCLLCNKSPEEMRKLLDGLSEEPLCIPAGGGRGFPAYFLPSFTLLLDFTSDKYFLYNGGIILCQSPSDFRDLLTNTCFENECLALYKEYGSQCINNEHKNRWNSSDTNVCGLVMEVSHENSDKLQPLIRHIASVFSISSFQPVECVGSMNYPFDPRGDENGTLTSFCYFHLYGDFLEQWHLFSEYAQKNEGRSFNWAELGLKSVTLTNIDFHKYGKTFLPITRPVNDFRIVPDHVEGKISSDPLLCLPDGSVFTLNSVPVTFSWSQGENNLTLTKNKTAYLPVNQTKSTTSMSSKYWSSMAMGILTLVGNVLSITCLFVTFVVFLIVPTLRTVPGVIVMNLIVALLLSQLTFQVSSVVSLHRLLCKVIAASQHYFWLSAFLWMNALAFNVSSTFTNMSISKESKGWTTVLKCCIYAWGLPVLIIVSCIIVQLHTNLDFKYGGDLVCWISGNIALVITFACPLAMIMTANIFLISRGLIGLGKLISAPAVRGSTTINRDRERIKLCIKLSSLMGMTWIFGFLANALESNILWYFFIIFNTTQGLYIGLAFLFNQKVYSAFREYACCFCCKAPEATAVDDVKTSSGRNNENTKRSIEMCGSGVAGHSSSERNDDFMVNNRSCIS